MDIIKLKTVESLYKEFKEKSTNVIWNIKNSNCKIMYSKGKLTNVYPYEIERTDECIPNGKVVEKLELKDGYYTYYFNDDNQVWMIEYASSFLKKNYKYEIYDYSDGLLVKYRYEISGICSVMVFFNNDNGISQAYKLYDAERLEICKYSYVEEKLNLIYVELYNFITQTKMREWKEEFFYNQTNELMGIQRLENGYRSNIFSKKKISVKKLESQIMNCINDVICKESINNMYISINIALENKVPYVMVSGHEYQSEKIELKECYLDEDEKDKIRNLILRIIITGWNQEVIDTKHKFKLSNNGKSVLKIKNRLPRWFTNNSQIMYDDFIVLYKKNHNKKCIKKINEIKDEISNSINHINTLEEIYSSFFGITDCNIDYEGEWLESDYYFCAETSNYKDELMFKMELSCYFIADDTIYRIGIRVFFECEEWNKEECIALWRSDVEFDFFNYISDTNVYKMAVNKMIHDKCYFFEQCE